jgi:hypothetical protein
MRMRDALLLSGACLILVACLHTMFGFEPNAADLAGTGAVGLVVGLAAPLPSYARRDLVLLGGVLLLATAAHATFGVALTVRGLDRRRCRRGARRRARPAPPGTRSGAGRRG